MYFAVNIHGMEMKVSPKDFLDTRMSKRVIKKIELYRMEPEDSYIYATYKVIMKILYEISFPL